MYKVLIADQISKEGLELLRSNPKLEVIEKTAITPEELTAEIGEYHALVVRSRSKVTAEQIANAHNMKLIVRGGVGTDNIDKKAATEKGIKVMNTPKASSVSVAELVLGMMLSGVRDLTDATESMKAGKWEKKTFKGKELYGKTLGILGVGNIGKEIATRSMAFGMKVLAFDPYAKEVPAGVEMTDLNKILQEADIISVNCPKTDETKGMINKSNITQLKKGVGIINCSRGGIIEEAALIEALDQGHVSFVGLDVFEKEPPDNTHPIAQKAHVTLTPHIGAQTVEGQNRVSVEVAEVINNFFNQL